MTHDIHYSSRSVALSRIHTIADAQTTNKNEKLKGKIHKENEEKNNNNNSTTIKN